MSHPSPSTIDIAIDARPLAAEAPRAARIALVIGALGLAVGLIFGFVDGWTVFFRAYLLNYTYVLSLALGGLFFVLLQHLTRAGWSVVVRRPSELIAGTIPLLALLFLPILVPVLLGWRDLYPWSHAATVAEDELLQHKAAYLNVPFFIIRCALYFLIWSWLARSFLRRSLAQDATGDVALTHQSMWWSAPGMLLYALTVTFFAIDVLMSLNPHWFSTIWGVYFFSGSQVGFYSLLAIVLHSVRRSGRLVQSLTREHFHDVGKLAFGFVVFWAYIAFSQYMLIWYANIPEETVWYLPRQGDTWWIGVSLLLLFGHFVAPFLALVSRYPKRRPGLLVIVAGWLLLMHWLDLYYVVIPRSADVTATAPLHVADVALLFGLAGIFVAAFVAPLARVPLAPQRDPWLPEALSFENV